MDRLQTLHNKFLVFNNNDVCGFSKIADFIEEIGRFLLDFEVTDKGIVPCCGDGDTVLVGRERGDVDGVVRAVDLGGQRHVPVIDRLNHHIIISGIDCPNNDNLLIDIVIIHLRLNGRSREIIMVMMLSIRIQNDDIRFSI